MKITASPREPGQRRQDVLDRLDRELDIWVATADADGSPCMVPLWFVWHEEAVWLCTRLTNPTGRNLRDGGRTRLALGHTRDVVLIDGEVDTFALREAPPPRPARSPRRPAGTRAGQRVVRLVPGAPACGPGVARGARAEAAAHHAGRHLDLLRPARSRSPQASGGGAREQRCGRPRGRCAEWAPRHHRARTPRTGATPSREPMRNSAIARRTVMCNSEVARDADRMGAHR